MSNAVNDLLKAALQLSEDKRWELAAAIEDSLLVEDGEYEILTDKDFHAELNRRYEEARRDPSVLIPWEEVKKML